MPVTARDLTRLYNSASRLWLVGAGLSLLLPPSKRLGVWLPLHLALAGAVSVAISGNMTNFVGALTAAGPPRPLVAWSQLVMVNAGAALIAYGYAVRHDGDIVAAGGGCFLAGMALLLATVWSSWRRGLNRRHRLPMALYAVAVLCVLAGGTVGALLGSGAVPASRVIALRDTHMMLNVLGWASITIVATMMTLVPTVLRIRIPRWNAPAAAACLVAGVGMLTGGTASGARAVSVAGAVLYWAAGVQLSVMIAKGLAGPRSWPAPVAAKHMVCAVAWFVCGGAALTWACARGSFDEFVPTFEAVFVAGWILQVLVGSWLYLLPVGRPGGPLERRVWFFVMEIGANTQVATMNLGLALFVLGLAGFLPRSASTIGQWAALAAAAAAVAKTWTYPTLARVHALVRRSDAWWNRRTVTRS
jgi:nitrite reductase (NO-forming)